MMKRPWDDQSVPRIRTETAAYLAIRGWRRAGVVHLIRSPIHDLEYDANPDPARAQAIRNLLAKLPLSHDDPEPLLARAAAMAKRGLGPIDALHLSWAIWLKADCLVSADDRFVRRARRIVSGSLRVALPT